MISDDVRKTIEVLIEQSHAQTGAACPDSPKEPCIVRGWVYETQSIHPRMFGQCDRCQTIYVVVLPRRIDGDGWHEPQWAGELEKWSQEGSRVSIVNAVEGVLLSPSTAPRLAWRLTDHPISLTREIVFAILQQARMALDEEQRKLNERAEGLEIRKRELYDRELALSRRGRRQAAVKAREAEKAMLLKAKLLRAEATRLAKEITALREQRDIAQREALPVLSDFTAAALDSRAVICDGLAPTEIIYALVDPRDPTRVRYVGRTNDPVNRYRSHCTSGSDAVTTWAGEVLAEGRSPAMVLLERCERAAVIAREAHWIYHYRERHQADLNRTLPRLEIMA